MYVLEICTEVLKFEFRILRDILEFLNIESAISCLLFQVGISNAKILACLAQLGVMMSQCASSSVWGGFFVIGE